MGIKEFVAKRDEMLMKKDINALREFFKANKGYYNSVVMKEVLTADDEYLEEVLHLMIANATSLPIEMQNESKAWLKENGVE